MTTFVQQQCFGIPRIPRLKIDMEGWRKATQEVPATVKQNAVEIAIMTQETDHQDNTLADMESSSRRLESKRKADEPKGRKAKKRKFPKLEGWGEQEDVDSMADWIVEPESRNEVVKTGMEKVASAERIDKDISSILQKPCKVQDRKLAISEGVRKKKFVFNTRGKLTKKEVVELKRTHTNNIFDWVSKEKCKVLEKDHFEERMKDVDMDTDEVQVLEREERLQRVITRQQEFRVKKVCTDILEDVIKTVTQYRTVEMINTLLGKVADQAVEGAMINRMVREAEEYGPDARNKLELRLREHRKDEDRAAQSMIEEESKETRLKWMELKRKAWREKFVRGQVTKMVRDMAELSLEESIMEMSWLASEEVSQVTIMDTGLEIEPSVSRGFAGNNQNNGFGTSNFGDRATNKQDIPPPPTPGLSDNLAGMKLSPRVLKSEISNPTQIPTPPPTQNSNGLPVVDRQPSRHEIVT